eukprot:749284-Hanusia_phi.AAC.1
MQGPAPAMCRRPAAACPPPIVADYSEKYGPSRERRLLLTVNLSGPEVQAVSSVTDCGRRAGSSLPELGRLRVNFGRGC